MPDVTPTFEVTGITKRFGGVTALDAVSLSVDAGEIVALVGDNGAGKSTLIRCIAGAMTPDAGLMRLDGHDVVFRQPIDARRHGIETVHQNLALVDSLPVAANLFLGREETRGWGPLRVLNEARMRGTASEMLARFGISVPSVRDPIRTLSGGERQSVAIGRAVGWGSKIVVLDEPTAALGVRERGRVAGVIKGLREHRLAVLVVSHNLEEVFDISDRIYILRHGRLVGEQETKRASVDDVVALITGASHARR